MSKMIICVGCSASGKSTYAENLTREDDTFVEINRDEIRFSLCNKGERDWSKWKFNKKNENAVTEVVNFRLKTTRKLGFNIVISDTNLSSKIRNKWETWAKENNYVLEYKYFPCDWKTLVQRNSQRKGGLSESELWRQHKSYMQQFGMYGENKVEVYKEDSKLHYTLIVDLDGTVADMKCVRKPFDWHLVSQDKPRHEVINSVCANGLQAGHITFMSGRDGCCYEDTYKWIEKYIMDSTMKDVSWSLVMRPTGDWRKDDIIKYELFNKHVRGQYNVHSLFDDRAQVLRMWNILGIPNIFNVGGLSNEF